jgi:hypothetical protein
MSFGFRIAGSPNSVTAALAKQYGYGDVHQLEAFKQAASAIAEQAPAGSIVIVQATGHHDYSEGAVSNADRAQAGAAIANLDLKIEVLRVATDPQKVTEMPATSTAPEPDKDPPAAA